MIQEEQKKEIKMEDVKNRAEEKKCPVQKSLVFIKEFLGGPMCGKCFPCSLGSYEAEIQLKNIINGTATEEDIKSLKRITSHMLVASMCKKGKDTARYVIENIDSGEFMGHISGACPSSECTEFIEYRIIPQKCTICGICQDVCKDNAIIGEKKVSYRSGYMPFEIVQKRCTKCGECIKVCPYDAIECVSTQKPLEKEKEKIKA
jgi:ferredoxin